MSRTAPTRSRTNPNPGQVQIQADREAVAADHLARAQRRNALKQAEQIAKVEKLSSMEHKLMQEDLNEKMPHAPKAKRPLKGKAAPSTVEDFQTEEPPIPVPSKLVKTSGKQPAKKTSKEPKVTLREAVNGQLDVLAATGPLTEQKGQKRKTNPAPASQDYGSAEEEHPEPKKGRYEAAEEGEDEEPVQELGKGGRRKGGHSHSGKHAANGKGHGGAKAEKGAKVGKAAIPGGKLRGGAAVRAKKLQERVLADD